jgi:hypothetical protein
MKLLYVPQCSSSSVKNIAGIQTVTTLTCRICVPASTEISLAFPVAGVVSERVFPRGGEIRQKLRWAKASPRRIRSGIQFLLTR